MRIFVRGVEEFQEEFSPRRLRRAFSRVVNEQAFLARKEFIGVVHSRMTVRSPRFVAGSVVARKGRLGGHGPWESRVGSIERDRFSGWEEQEKGTNAKRPRKATLMGRGGSHGKKMRPTARLKPGHNVPDRRKMGARGVPEMIRKVRQAGGKRFLVHKGQHPRIPAGYYELINRGKNFRRMQSFGKWHPKRIPILDQTMNRYIRRVNMAVELRKAMLWVRR